jgi:hypothetical protein
MERLLLWCSGIDAIPDSLADLDEPGSELLLVRHGHVVPICHGASGVIGEARNMAGIARRGRLERLLGHPHTQDLDRLAEKLVRWRGGNSLLEPANVLELVGDRVDDAGERLGHPAWADADADWLVRPEIGGGVGGHGGVEEDRQEVVVAGEVEEIDDQPDRRVVVVGGDRGRDDDLDGGQVDLPGGRQAGCLLRLGESLDRVRTPQAVRIRLDVGLQNPDRPPIGQDGLV